MAKNRVARPIINLKGRDFKKSSSAYFAVRIDKNINREVRDDKRASASEMINTSNAFLPKKIVTPSLLLPPGTVNAAGKTTLEIRVATTMQEFEVSFIQLSPFLTRSSCFSVNSSQAVFLSSSLLLINSGLIHFSTSYIFAHCCC
ncbi:hypothetical protein CFOL_v3_35575 [Cephalotus follicularis]|uniref:Uncharacterized protein n=1 Tax=Cephalotus follicularis TaxID=3775 RepID=A0A1Q3DI81_CEPFO|nr:hypothetical protein CFOL_v3_35575 [Cephalotus follicularis]